MFRRLFPSSSVYKRRRSSRNKKKKTVRRTEITSEITVAEKKKRFEQPQPWMVHRNQNL